MEAKHERGFEPRYDIIETPFGEAYIAPMCDGAVRIETGYINVEGFTLTVNNVPYHGTVTFEVDKKAKCGYKVSSVYLTRRDYKDATPAASKKAGDMPLPVAAEWATKNLKKLVETDKEYARIRAGQLRERIADKEKEIDGLRKELAEEERKAQ